MTDANTSIDALLEGTVEDLADLPEVGPWPVGTHLAKILKWEVKKDLKDKVDASKMNAVVNLTLEALQTVEPADPEKVVSPGQRAYPSYFLIHHSSPQAQEIGQGGFKEIMKACAEHFGPDSNANLMKQSTGKKVLVTTKLRKDSNGDMRTSVVSLVIAE